MHKLAIIGPLTPPIGGVGTHLERLMPHLDRADVDYVIYNTAGPTEIPGRAVSVAARKKWWFFRYILRGREPVVFIRSNQWQIWAASRVLSQLRGKKVVIALYGESLRWAWETHGRRTRRLIARGFESAERLIAANTHIRDFLQDMGGFSDKTSVIPAFIPPVWRDEDDAAVTEEAKRFCADHDPVILATGAPVLRENNTDLYGIDMTIELVDRLRASYPKIGVLWSLLNFIGSIPEYADKMRDEVTRRGLDGSWLFSAPQDVFYPVYKMADVFVRPTLSDGDAISVREALHFGLPAVASDAVPRPAGVTTFRKRDQEDYERAVRQTLETLDAERQRLADLPSDTAVEEEVTLLQEVIAEADA